MLIKRIYGRIDFSFDIEYDKLKYGEKMDIYFINDVLGYSYYSARDS